MVLFFGFFYLFYFFWGGGGIVSFVWYCFCLLFSLFCFLLFFCRNDVIYCLKQTLYTHHHIIGQLHQLTLNKDSHKQRTLPSGDQVKSARSFVSTSKCCKKQTNTHTHSTQSVQVKHCFTLDQEQCFQNFNVKAQLLRIRRKSTTCLKQ